MTRAGRPTKRRVRAKTVQRSSVTVVDILKRRLTHTDTDPRSDAEFLADMRAKQAAGQLANPATAALIDRLQRAI